MSTLKLHIKDGRIIEAVNAEHRLEKISRSGHYACGNGWEVHITPKSPVSKGTISTTYRHGDKGRDVLRRNFTLRDGYLSLSGGSLDHRYSSFVSEDRLNDLFKEYGISAYICERPGDGSEWAVREFAGELVLITNVTSVKRLTEFLKLYTKKSKSSKT